MMAVKEKDIAYTFVPYDCETKKRIDMKKRIIFLFLACVAFAQAQAQVIPGIIQNHKDRALFTKVGEAGAKLEALFNGKNLDGWYTYTTKYGKNQDQDQEFKVENGVLHFQGEPMGYICTNKSYKNYYLRVVFRWGDKKYPPREESARDSGVLYHFPDGVDDILWPKSIECRIQENDCGDYWCVGGTNADSQNKNTVEWDQKRIYRTANHELPNPEWNTIEIICYDDKSEHYVNGHLVNEAYNLSVTEGKILLQLEGAEIYYKSVELLPLK